MSPESGSPDPPATDPEEMRRLGHAVIDALADRARGVARAMALGERAGSWVGPHPEMEPLSPPSLER